MKKSIFKLLIVIGFLAIILAGCGAQEENVSSTKEEKETKVTETENSYPNGDLLVDVEWVKNNLDNENVRFVDMRAEGYEGGHIPGAVNITWQEMNDPENPVKGFLAPPDPFTTLMQDLGINEDTTVVAYDDGSSLSAARLFYALEYYGHDNVKILNGGITGWLSAGEEVSTDEVVVEKGNFKAAQQENLVTRKDFLVNNLDNQNLVILDVRSPEEYNGEDVRSDRGGHIPNAVNLNWTNAITEKDGVPTFKSAEELKKQFENIGVKKDKTIVPYCQTNVRGAHTYFALRLLGYEKISPYEGSWSEWGNDPSLPIEK